MAAPQLPPRWASGLAGALINNIPNIAALVISAIVSIRLGLNPNASSERVNLTLAAVAGVLTLICANQVWIAIRTADEKSAVDSVFERFGSVETSLETLARRSEYVFGALQDGGRLVACPTSKPSVYVDLFGGFTQTYYAYNPAYAIEKKSVLTDAEKALIKEVYVPRYKAVGNCTARYLFLTRDEEGKKSLEKFKELMIKVAAGSPNTVKSLHVKEIKTEHAATHDEIYFGTQHGRPVVIHELSAPLDSHGQPSFYYVSESADLFEACRNNFDAEWDSPKADWVHNPADASSTFFKP